MAQTKRKRRRKHRGTQGGRIDTRPVRGRARSRAEAQARARGRTSGKKKAGPRTPGAPSWSTALKKGAVASVLFIGLLAFFGQNPAYSLVVGIALLGFYVPLAYMMDGFFYRRHLRKEAEKRAERDQRRAGQPEG
jgi:hypothetical protein